MPVDKQVTIRLDVVDDLTPAFRAAARSADDLARAVDKAAGKQAGLGDGAAVKRAAADMRATAVEAGRLERAVTVAGRATSRGFAGAERSIAPLTGRLNDAADAAERVTKRYEGMASAGRTMMIAGVASAAAIGLVAKKYADFDSAMSTVAANTGAVGSQLDALRSKAIELGSATQYSGREAAQGINELAKAGVSTGDILGGGLKGALSLAAAGQIEVGEAAEIAASAMTQFGLAGSEVPRIADMLAAGANKAQGGVRDLGAALNQAGLVAASTGLSIDETVGSLTAFASAGMTGSDAGTSLKTMLQRLNPASEEAAGLMDALNLSAYDANGQFIGMAEYAGRLQTSMAGLSPQARSAAMNILYGADAVRAANILYRQGEGGIRAWTNAVQASGFAQRNAAALTNNLTGDLERFGGAIDGVVLTSGGGLNNFLRSLVQGATQVVDTFGKVPAPILETGLTLGAVATAATVTGGAVLFMVPKVLAARAALTELSVSSAAAATSLRVLGTAAAVVGVAVVIHELAGLAAQASVTRGNTDALAASLRGLNTGTGDAAAFIDLMANKQQLLGNKIDTTSEALSAFGQQAKFVTDNSLMGFLNRSSDFTMTTDKFTTRVEELDAAFAKMVQNGQVAEAEAAFQQLMDSVKASGGNVEEVSAMFGQYTQAAQAAGEESSRLTREQELAAAAALGMSDAELKAADSAEVAAKLTDKFKSAVESLGQTLLAQRDAERGFQAAIDDVTASLEKNGRSLDIHTEAGRSNQAALDAVASSGAKAAAELFNTSGSVEQTAAKVQQVQDEFVAAAGKFGIGEAAARQLATQLGLTTDQVVGLASQMGQVPTGVTSLVQLQGIDAAQAGLDELTTKMNIPPAVLKAPIMGDFVRGMGSAMGWADKLEQADPTVDVSQVGAAGVIAELEKTTGAALTTDAQSPQVAVSEVGAMGVQGMLGKVTGAAKTTDAQSPQVSVSERGAAATKSRLSETTAQAQTLNRQEPTVKVGVSGVAAAISNINRVLNAARNAAASAVLIGVNRLTGRADGGVDYYAGGGVRERHVAQIARAGAWRVWAEDETGGEAYIPLAPAKRARSTAILEEVARRFGLAVVRQAEGGVMRFAGGGTTVATQSAARTVNVAGFGKAPVIPVTAKVTKVTIPAGVQAPFLYTPGGKWDTSTPRAKAATSAITAEFRDRYVSADMVAEARAKLLEAEKAAAEAGVKLAVSAAKKLTTASNQVKSAQASLTAAQAALEKARASKTATSTQVKAARERVDAAQARLSTAQSNASAAQSNASAARNATNAARAAGKTAGSQIVATNAAYVGGVKDTVKSKTKPTDARAAALANALSMNKRGSYVWGGGHQSGYYKNSAALAADCSGFVGWAIGHAIGRNATGNSTSMLNGGSLGYVRIDPNIAAKTAGALMGRAGHIVMSLGDGRVIESYKTGKPVQIRNLRKSDYAKASWNTALGPMTQATAAQITGGYAGTATVGAAGGAASTAADVERLAQAQREYADALAASRIPARTTFAKATQESTRVSSQFLGFIRRIRDRGFADVAYQLLMIGEDNGGLEVAASFANGTDKELRNQRANFAKSENYETLRGNLEKSLGTLAGPPAWVTATRQATTSNTEWSTFLANIEKVSKRGFPTLAAAILDMGVEDGADLARQAVTLSDVQLRAMRNALTGGDALTQRQAKLSSSLNGPANVQAAAAMRKANASSATFLNNVSRLADRGYSSLALHYMELGEESAGESAAAAVAATDAVNAESVRQIREREALDKRATDLEATLRGWGKTVNVAPGVATGGVGPAVTFDAPRAVDARPTSPTVIMQAARPAAQSGPLLVVENMNTVNPASAVTAMETRLGDVVSVHGLNSVGR